MTGSDPVWLQLLEGVFTWAVLMLVVLWLVRSRSPREVPKLWCGCPRGMSLRDWDATHDDHVLEIKGARVRCELCLRRGVYCATPMQDAA